MAHQSGEEGTECVSAVGAEPAGDIFGNGKSSAACMDDLDPSEREVAAVAVQSGAQSSDRKILAWGASNDHVRRQSLDAIKEIIGQHIAQVWNVGIMVRENGTREWLNLGNRDAAHPERMPGDRRGFYPGEI